jgi:hypothetical protein
MIRNSEIIARRSVREALEQDYSNYTVGCNTPLCSLSNAGGFTLTNSVQHTGNGAGSTDNIFTVTSNVRIFELYGVCTAVGDATTFGLFKWEIDDGAAQDDLSTGVPAAGIVVGGMLVRGKSSANATVFANPTSVTVVESDSKYVFEPMIILQKTGDVTSYIRANYTGDANTDITINYHCRWAPITDTSNVEAV